MSSKPPGPSAAPEEPPVPRQDLAAGFRHYGLELVRLAMLLTGNQQTAADTVQDVFTRVYPRWYTLTDRGSDPLPYIRAAVIKACRSAHRRRGLVRRLLGARAVTPGHPAPGPAGDGLPSGWQRVLEALGTLPRRQREALVLRYYLHIPHAEVAAAMSTSCRTIKSAISHGLGSVARATGEDRMYMTERQLSTALTAAASTVQPETLQPPGRRGH